MSLAIRVDPARIKEVGPDRAAAEWLLRCGAGVRWKGSEKQLTDYNSLSPGGFRQNFIEEIDATNSCIMSVGFPHLSITFSILNYFLCFHTQIYPFVDGLKHLKKVTLHKCDYLDNEALPMLAYVKETLQELQISSCGNIDDEGVKSLDCLTGLQNLLLFDLPEVTDKKGCEKHLKNALSKCEIQFPYAQAAELEKNKK